MKNYAVIMAGGGGTRFWPLSRQNTPKQLLNITGNDVMINETISRLDGIIKVDNIYIVTNENQCLALKNLVTKKFSIENILVEPIQRNTAPCILYAAMYLHYKKGDSVLCILPSDQYISQTEQFKEVIRMGMEIAYTDDIIVTIGIKPTFPSTGYGYIKYENNEQKLKQHKVVEFVEKPNFELAKNYLASGNYLWNSGIFISKTSQIINSFKRFLPRIHEKMESIFESELSYEDKLQEIYPQLQNISFDYGIMERANNVYVIPGDFGWNDVGSWDSLGSIFLPDKDGNIIKAEHIGINTKNSIIYGNSRLIATVEIENMIIVNTDDALLVCPKNKAQDVKKIVDMLKEAGKQKLI